eukprot:GGOE01048105.1.p1 GENE.GGOE01048105.1~~GGOE01048105.1.p1  ORF type:complete len:821 (-),score=222.74 GGOE01048105.1:1479-3941(-)
MCARMHGDDEWCRSGVDLVIATGVGLQQCMSSLAAAYPNISFLSTAGFLTGPPNYANIWVRFYETTFLAGYTAGLMTNTKKVCISTTLRIPVALIDVTGFCRGVHSADPSVQIHIFATGQLRYPMLEVWIVNQSYALGCDVVLVQSLAVDGTQRAQDLGIMSIGFFTDARLTVGEGVVTSVIVDMAPAYVRAADAVLNGTFQSEVKKADWWMDWSWGAMHLANFSFLVPKDVQTKVMAQVSTLDRVFCGRVCTQTHCICNSSSCCLNDTQMYSFDSYPDFAHDHGFVQLPGLACKAGQLATWHLDTSTTDCSDCPAGTYAYNLHAVSECRPCPPAMFSLAGATNCTACPPGTYGNQLGQGHCTPCPAGSTAGGVASVECKMCPSGLSSNDRTECETVSLLWVAEVVGGTGGGLLLFGLLLLWLTRRYGKRNNRAAPKDASQPFCILFTDIQGGTGLWATIPDLMARVMDTHHTLMRTLIAKHQCYEVKTIGDSFMCAVHTPQQAVGLALAIQTTLHHHDWGTEDIDLLYAGDVAPQNSASCWNGLRVRVGIHYGLGDIRFDAVSQGYDYYGTVVNTAARIESACHGGQIGVSQEVFDALGGSLPGSVWTDLGPHELRGLSEPIRLYQILPDGPYAMRTFPPLRVEKEDQVHEALQAAEEVAVVTQDGGSTKDGGLGRDPSGISAAGDWKWVETHPLVVHGDISAEELKKNFIIALTTLSTLLSTQTNKFKEAVLQGLCDRLHVTNFGVQGAQLQRTLKGLVHRVLPATVMNTQCELVSRQMSGVSGSIPVVDINTLNSFRGSPKEPRNKVIPVVQDAEDS